jgi:hypothetical protein
MGLQDQLKGVIAEEPAQDSPPVDTEEAPVAEVEATSSDDRSPENIRGELLRKQDKGFRALDDRLNMLADQVTKLASSMVETRTQPQNAATDSFDDFTVEQLEALRPQVEANNPDQLRAFDYELLKRRTDEAVKQRMNMLDETTRLDNERRQYLEIVTHRYPDIKVPGSDFYREVDVRVREEEAKGNKDPKLVLNIANEVFASKPSLHARRTVETIHKTGGTRTAPVDAPKTKGVRSDEERQEIANKLKRALL